METHAINNGLDSSQTHNLLNAGRTYNFYEYENEVDNYQQDNYTGKDLGVDTPEFRSQVNAKRSAGFTSKPSGHTKPKKRSHTTIVYDRNPRIIALVECRAAGKCELCGSKAPFTRPDGTLYLEVHHIIPLADDGEEKHRHPDQDIHGDPCQAQCYQ